MIKCEINTENFVTTEIRGKAEDVLDEFSTISKEIAKDMLQNGLSTEETMVILAACVSQGIGDAYELYNHRKC